MVDRALAIYLSILLHHLLFFFFFFFTVMWPFAVAWAYSILLEGGVYIIIMVYFSPSRSERTHIVMVLFSPHGRKQIPVFDNEEHFNVAPIMISPVIFQTWPLRMRELFQCLTVKSTNVATIMISPVIFPNLIFAREGAFQLRSSTVTFRSCQRLFHPSYRKLQLFSLWFPSEHSWHTSKGSTFCCSSAEASQMWPRSILSETAALVASSVQNRVQRFHSLS